MCGIAGILSLRGEAPERQMLQRMCDRLCHRGPEDEGIYAEGAVMLGQRRLKIIDLVTGHQPLSNEDGTVWVTFNGEIYNFVELREQLRASGHSFRTGTDSEVIVHAYEQWGDECVKRFRGMFAFALWDSRKRCVLLARDHVGKKPMFYAIDGDRILFASELQAIIPEMDDMPSENARAVDEFMTYGYIPAPHTGYNGVSKLPPAHYLHIDLDGQQRDLVPQRYWSLDYTTRNHAPEAQVAEELMHELETAVRLRLIADVPIGALLSGGLDSSLVVALMTRVGTGRVRTFSIGFDDRSFNELPYARRVAEILGTDHHEMIVRPDAMEILPLLVRHYGEPYADSSAIPSYYVTKMTREHVTVALNGDGGDESFGGYDRYLGVMVGERYKHVPSPIRAALRNATRVLVPDSLHPRNRLRQMRRFLAAVDAPANARYARWMTYFTPEAKEQLYTPEYAASLGSPDGGEWLMKLVADGQQKGWPLLGSLLSADLQSYLPYDLLVKMDIAAMANSLETRSPFLDVKVMEYAAALPPNLKIRGSTLKYLTKRLALRFFPRELIYRRKQGFAVPIGGWLRKEMTPLVEEVLLGRRMAERGMFRPDAIRNIVDRHRAGFDHSSQLWALLCLELWYQQNDAMRGRDRHVERRAHSQAL